MKAGGTLTRHSFPNLPCFTSAQSYSITDQMYPPVCAAPVSFPSDTLLLPLVSVENDKTGTTAELSVPHTTGRKLPSFHSFSSISSNAVLYVCSFTEMPDLSIRFSLTHFLFCSQCVKDINCSCEDDIK